MEHPHVMVLAQAAKLLCISLVPILVVDVCSVYGLDDVVARYDLATQNLMKFKVCDDVELDVAASIKNL